MKRPGPLLWLRYAATGSLPPEYATWVLHDTTCGTWVLRHVARVCVLVALPAAAVLVLLPAALNVRLMTTFVAVSCVVLLTGILANDMTERRLQKAGYPWGTGERARGTRAVDAQRTANRERRERIEERRRRRRT